MDFSAVQIVVHFPLKFSMNFKLEL